MVMTEYSYSNKFEKNNQTKKKFKKTEKLEHSKIQSHEIRIFESEYIWSS